MNEEEAKEIIDNMSEQELNDFIFFALQEVEKENQKLKTELEKKDRQLEERTNRIRNLEKECQSNFDNMMDTIRDNSKKDKIIDLMAEDKYENINMIQMANIGKEVNYDPTKLFSGIPDEEAIKIIKQYYEKKAEEDK